MEKGKRRRCGTCPSSAIAPRSHTSTVPSSALDTSAPYLWDTARCVTDDRWPVSAPLRCSRYGMDVAALPTTRWTRHTVMRQSSRPPSTITPPLPDTHTQEMVPR